MRKLLLLSLLVAAACDQSNPYDPYQAPPPTAAKMIGQDPETFDCKLVYPEQEIVAIVGGPVVKVDAPIEPEPGMARPCIYRLRSDGSQLWQLLLDCRNLGHMKAEEVMAIETAKGPVVPVTVGKRGLDHSQIRLIALDDDTPCAVYVTGPDAAKREALARLSLKNLNETTQPRTPRAVEIRAK